jgi:hypothetical protein
MLSRHAAALVLVAAVWSPVSAGAQESRSVALAQELVSLLDAAKTDCAAARLIGSSDEFVAVMYFPGQQLLAIQSKYAAPPLLNERIILRKFKDVYLDLNAATVPAGRMMIEDLQANGLKVKNVSNAPSDYFAKGTDPRFQFDGQWRKRKLSQDEYLKAFAEADALYTKILESVIAEFKKGS